MNGTPELEQSSALASIEEASETGGLLLCSISLVEIATYARQDRIRPAMPVREWIARSLQTPGLELVYLDTDVAAEAAALPGQFSGDGADRVIVAAARLRHAFLATADSTLTSYGRDGHVKLLEI
jgi:PIN domain nuclease of toxin-antitoxin system